jgi:serine/threonine-protein kinase HipA
MTSRKLDETVYVHVTLSGQTQPVLAGRYILSARSESLVGQFAYARSYRERKEAVELDPRELKLGSSAFETARAGGVFGALRDATPDAWGRRLIEQQVAAARVDLSPVDYMLRSPDDRAGALAFGLGPQPPAPRRAFNRTIDLCEFVEKANALIADEARPEDRSPTQGDAAQTDLLDLLGTGLGGARPKATVEDGEALWVAKFPIIADPARGVAGDRWNNTRVEHATTLLARECGLICAETRLIDVGGRDVLLSRRFDRRRLDDGYERMRMVSALTMLGQTEDDYGRWSYLELADDVKRRAGHARPEQLVELYRRIAFNTLISNTDDHPRNHAFLGHGTDWLLSPAYDLTPTPAVGQERYLAMAFGKFGRAATRDNLLSMPGHFGIAPPDAEALVDTMASLIRSRWHAVARAAGVTEADCERIRSAFVHDGFGAKLS